MNGLLGELLKYIQDASPGGLLNPEWSPERRQQALTMAQDFTPVWGGVKGAKEEWEQGNPGMAVFNAATVPFDLASMGLLGLGVKGIGKGIKAINPMMDNLKRIETEMADIAARNSSLDRALSEFTKGIQGSGSHDGFGGFGVTDDDILQSFQSRMFKKEPVMLRDAETGQVFEVSKPDAALKMYKFMQAQKSDAEKKFGDLALEQYRLRQLMSGSDK